MLERVLIVDDHPMCSHALSLAVSRALHGIEVDQAATLYLAEQAARRFPTYRCVLLDLILPDVIGFSGLLRLQKILPNVPIAIVSGLEDADIKAKALHLGAVAVLPKALPIEELSLAIARVARGERETPPETGSKLDDLSALRGRFETLTTGQLRVVMALHDGLPTKQIAHNLAVGEATVKAHLGAAFRKLGVVNRTQAVLLVRQFHAEPDMDRERDAMSGARAF